ncbi:SsrA-binding protein [Flavobacterium sp.]
MYRLLAQINKILLPSFTKKRMDLSKVKKWQMAILAWRYYITCRALDEKN